MSLTTGSEWVLKALLNLQKIVGVEEYNFSITDIMLWYITVT